MQSGPVSGGNLQDRAALAQDLCAARQRSGRSLQQIADATKISPRNLEALESGRFDALPGGVYRRAFVRSYAASVGLDPKVILERFDRAVEPDRVLPTAEEPSAAPRRPVLRVTISIDAAWWAALQRVIARGSIAAVAGILVGALGTYILLQNARLSFWPFARTSQLPRSASGAALLDVSTGHPRQSRRTQAGKDDVRPASAAAAPTGSEHVSRRDVDSVAASKRRPAATASTVAVTGTSGSLPVGTARPITPPEPRLIVTSEPAGARVTVDGVGWGVTPLTIRHLPAGDKVVRITKDGYVARERRVRVDEAAATTTVRLSLRQRE